MKKTAGSVIEEERNRISKEVYGKPYSELPDDGPEQDHIMNLVDKELSKPRGVKRASLPPIDEATVGKFHFTLTKTAEGEYLVEARFTQRGDEEESFEVMRGSQPVDTKKLGTNAVAEQVWQDLAKLSVWSQDLYTEMLGLDPVEGALDDQAFRVLAAGVLFDGNPEIDQRMVALDGPLATKWAADNHATEWFDFHKVAGKLICWGVNENFDAEALLETIPDGMWGGILSPFERKMAQQKLADLSEPAYRELVRKLAEKAKTEKGKMIAELAQARFGKPVSQLTYEELTEIHKALAEPKAPVVHKISATDGPLMSELGLDSMSDSVAQECTQCQALIAPEEMFYMGCGATSPMNGEIICSPCAEMFRNKVLDKTAATHHKYCPMNESRPEATKSRSACKCKELEKADDDAAKMDKKAEWMDWQSAKGVEVVVDGGVQLFDTLEEAKAQFPTLDPVHNGPDFTWAMAGNDGRMRFESWAMYRMLSQ